MPNCFTLTRKGASEPDALQEVDKAMCDHFAAPCCDVQWYRNWYNTVGFGIACGHSPDKLEEYFPDQAAIVDWLFANYTTDAWAERGRS